MNLNYTLLNTIIKYPVSSVEIDKNSGDIRTKRWAIITPSKIFLKR